MPRAHEGLRSSLLSGRLPLWGTMQDIHHPPQVQQQLQQPLHQSSVFATLQPRVSNGVGHDQLTAQQAPVLPLPQPQPGQDTQQPDTGSITHIRWLLALSPRLRSVLPRVCGPQAVNAALTRAGSGNRVNGSASAGSNRRTATAGSGASSSLTTNTTQPQPYSSVTGTGTKHGSYSLSAQHSIGTLSQVAPVPPVAVPQELRLCWAGLMCAVGFCDRCSKTARARVGAGGADRGGGSSENGKGESKAAASTAVGPGSVKQPGGPQEGAADVSTKYWFTLLEVSCCECCVACHPAVHGDACDQTTDRSCTLLAWVQCMGTLLSGSCAYWVGPGIAAVCKAYAAQQFMPPVAWLSWMHAVLHLAHARRNAAAVP
jgi:hypothetical protein